MKLPVRFVVFAAVLLLGATAFASDVPIPVVNPSFEVPIVGGTNQWSSYLYGWNQTGSAGVWQPSPTLLSGTDGLNAAWVGSGYISQVLTTTLASNSTYTLTVQVGQRADMAYSPIGYIVQFLAGGIVLAYDNSSLHPTPGTYGTSVVTYTTPDGSSLIGQNLEIRLVQTSGQVSFDNVQLTDPINPNFRVTPEPASMVLLGAGLLSLAGLARRRRS